MEIEIIIIGGLFTMVNGLILLQMKKQSHDMHYLKEAFPRYEAMFLKMEKVFTDMKKMKDIGYDFEARFVKVEKDILQLKHRDSEAERDLDYCQVISKQSDQFIHDKLNKIDAQVTKLMEIQLERKE